MAKNKKERKAAFRAAEASEVARQMLMTGYAALLADDSMQQRRPDAVALAGFMLDYYGNRRYEDAEEREEAEKVLEDWSEPGAQQ